MRRAGLPFVALMLAAATGSGALAFTLGGSRWFGSSTVFHVGIPGTAPSGVAWSAALRSAMSAWTSQTAFDFVADDSYLDPCVGLRRNESGDTAFPLGSGDGRNGVDFRTNVCGNSFGSGVLAVTMSIAGVGPLGFPVYDQTDIIFNSNHQWDVYSGPIRQRIDFGRVALHEFGHALGLDHSTATSTIMAPNYGSVHTLQADDVDGANAIYAAGTCQVRDVRSNASISDSLGGSDCRVRDLYGGSKDTSFVDVYRLTLSRESDLDIAIQSNELDPVLILTTADLEGIQLQDDADGTCNSRIRRRLPAGEYRILVNTYEEPAKCAGNTGAYDLTISDSSLPVLGSVRSSTGTSTLASAVINGGATADHGATFPAVFAASQAIDVYGRVVPDAAHVGRPGRLYVLVMLDDGRRFAQTLSGDFVPFDGNLAQLPPRMTSSLRAQEHVSIASGLTGIASGLAGQTVTVYIGYALDSKPTEIWYGQTPIRFSFAP